MKVEVDTGWHTIHIHSSQYFWFFLFCSSLISCEVRNSITIVVQCQFVVNLLRFLLRSVYANRNVLNADDFGHYNSAALAWALSLLNSCQMEQKSVLQLHFRSPVVFSKLLFLWGFVSTDLWH